IAVRNRIAYLPEEKGLYKKMRSIELLTYFGTLKGLPARVAKQRGERLMHDYWLGNHLLSKCEAFSKGMQQKLELLMTVLHEPDLLILDDPFSGLDPVNVELIRKVIVEQSTAGRTVLFSTHNMDNA